MKRAEPFGIGCNQTQTINCFLAIYVKFDDVRQKLTITENKTMQNIVGLLKIV